MASPSVFKNADNVSQLAKATAAFGLDIYRTVSQGKDGENIFFSPISINTALAMTLLGAKGDTAEQMKSVLKVKDFGDSDLHTTFNDLHSVLQTDAKSGYIMKVASRVFARKNYTFLQEYLDATKSHYKAEAALMDFAGDAEGARVTINKWVEEQTNSKIQDLISSGALNALTAMVLVNAVYFKGDWSEKFDAKHTRNADFYLDSKQTVKADIMFKEDNFKVGYNAKLSTQVIELPYVGKDLSMVVLIPKRFALKELEANLTADNLLALMNDLHETKVMLHLPRFKLTNQFTLSETLKSLGMTDAFDERKADLSGMDGSRELHVSEVIHKSFIEVRLCC